MSCGVGHHKKDEPEMAPLNYGDTVKVRPSAPENVRPGSFAEVCGLSSNEPLPGRRVLIEFGDGSSVEVLEQHLEFVAEAST